LQCYVVHHDLPPFPTRRSSDLGDVSGTVRITGMPNAMSGVADIRSTQGRLAGEPLQSLTAHATFSGSSVDVDRVDLNFNAGHIRSEEHTSELQSRGHLVCRLLL